jgi:hypothetical protein
MSRLTGTTTVPDTSYVLLGLSMKGCTPTVNSTHVSSAIENDLFERKEFMSDIAPSHSTLSRCQDNQVSDVPRSPLQKVCYDRVLPLLFNFESSSGAVSFSRFSLLCSRQVVFTTLTDAFTAEIRMLSRHLVVLSTTSPRWNGPR